MRFLIFIFLAFAKTQRHSITWFEHLSVFHLISITICAWIALRGNMCTLWEHKQVLDYYRQWNNEPFLNTFSAFSNCKYKFCQEQWNYSFPSIFVPDKTKNQISFICLKKKTIIGTLSEMGVFNSIMWLLCAAWICTLCEKNHVSNGVILKKKMTYKRH